MRHRDIALTLLFAVSFGAGVAPLHAQQPTIAVFDFNAFSLSPGEDAAAVGRGLAGMIATELANRPQVRVVDRQEIERLIESRRITMSGRVDDAQAVQMGQLLGASYVVVGNVALEPERARIDIRLLNVESGAVEKADRRQGERDEFLTLVEEIADSFMDGLDLPARVAEAEVEIPVAASLAFSRGLDYERRGELDRAARMFRRALEIHPDHQAAAAALERVRSKGARS